MIKSFCATTREIDDSAAAVSEILTALNLGHNLLAHSLGIISCYSEFEDTGVLDAICNALPFDCIGSTTCLCASGQEVDQIIFAITVLTSDDCHFQTSAVPVGGHYEDTMAQRLPALLQPQAPAVFLSYFPLMNMVSGDMILAAIDNVTGGIPLFGTMAIDHTMDYSTAKTIYNGKTFREDVVLAGIYGQPDIIFEIASLDENKIRKQKAIITESQGNILVGVNGKTALEYLEEIGLTKVELSTGLGIIPLVVDHNDGTKPVARAVFALTPEGHAVCGGAMPVNATLAIGRVDMNDVLQTTAATMTGLLDSDSACLSYSCLARYLALGVNNTGEADTMRDIAGATSYLFACSGGEICPLPDADGNLKNFYHNYTNVFCRIK